jgi:kynurenine formamidase
MIVQFEDGRKIDLKKGFDLSLPLSNSDMNPTAWYVQPPRFEPVMENGWVGSVELGGAVNFRNIYFNPHGHGTHTECLGHITKKIHSINEQLNTYFFEAILISATPEEVINEGENDFIITKKSLAALKTIEKAEALIIRSLPNSSAKKTQHYSATNPPYLSLDCLEEMNRLGVKHLLIDLPSVDRESDGGALAFHHQYWGVPEKPDMERTITELIYVDNKIPDGEYILNMQVAPFENDASPSRPVLYPFV